MHIAALQSGPVAQLGARFHGMEEVVGSIPTRSTNRPKTFFVYILQSESSGRFYIGSAEDVDVRLADHQRGQTRRGKVTFSVGFHRGRTKHRVCRGEAQRSVIAISTG